MFRVILEAVMHATITAYLPTTYLEDAKDEFGHVADIYTLQIVVIISIVFTLHLKVI